MIKGLTHDIDGIANIREDYKGKISTGYAPYEAPPNFDNPGPMSSDHFRVLREETKSVQIPGTDRSKQIQKWKDNTPMQGILNGLAKSDKPQILAFTSMYKTPDEFWYSYVGKYAKSGLQCKSQGEGTVAEEAYLDTNNAKCWRKREFVNAKTGEITNTCPYRECPDYQAKACTSHGTLKIFPQFDLSPFPYRYDTQSEGTIASIEFTLHKMWEYLQASHYIRCRDAGQQLPFEGFIGSQWFIRMKKQTGAKGENYVVKLLPSKALSEYIMGPIKSEVLRLQQSQKTGSGAITLFHGKGPDFALGIESETRPQLGVQAQVVYQGQVDDIDDDDDLRSEGNAVPGVDLATVYGIADAVVVVDDAKPVSVATAQVETIDDMAAAADALMADLNQKS